MQHFTFHLFDAIEASAHHFTVAIELKIILLDLTHRGVTASQEKELFNIFAGGKLPARQISEMTKSLSSVNYS